MPRVRGGIGILGGTFDPIHFGHLRMAEEAREALGLERVLIVPCLRPPHRPLPVAPAEERLAMARAAVRGNPALRVWPGEVRRGGVSYSYDTLVALRRIGRPLTFLLGTDAFREIPGWHRVRELFALCSIAVVDRPGFEAVDLSSVLEVAAPGSFCYDENLRRFMHQSGHSVSILSVPPLDISATALRRTVAAGRSIRYLVPDSVLGRILARGLYGAGGPPRRRRSLR